MVESADTDDAQAAGFFQKLVKWSTMKVNWQLQLFDDDSNGWIPGKGLLLCDTPAIFTIYFHNLLTRRAMLLGTRYCVATNILNIQLSDGSECQKNVTEDVKLTKVRQLSIACVRGE